MSNGNQVAINFSPLNRIRDPLEDEQRLVIESLERGSLDICIIAGPATGKTRVIEDSVIKLIEMGVDPEDILPFTFTVTGKEVMNKRLLGTGVRAYSIHGNGMRNSKKGREEFLKTSESIVPNFDGLLEERKPGEKLYEWILCDEGQDLTLKQYKSFLSWGKHHLLVGDPWQSLFTYSGADPALLYKFRDTLCNGKSFDLIVNHRSLSNIVSVSNKFSNRNMEVSLYNKNREKGLVYIGSNFDYSNPITILIRTNPEADLWSSVLREMGIEHTLIMSNNGEKRIRNWSNKKYKDISSVNEYLPYLVCTIHMAKGEEWDRVLLAYRRRSFMKDDRLEECIFYVGLTRAKKELYIQQNNRENRDFIRRIENAKLE